MNGQVFFYINDSIVDIGNDFTINIVSSDTNYTYNGIFPVKFHENCDDLSSVVLVFKFENFEFSFPIDFMMASSIEYDKKIWIYYYSKLTQNIMEYHIKDMPVVLFECYACNLLIIFPDTSQTSPK